VDQTARVEQLEREEHLPEEAPDRRGRRQEAAAADAALQRRVAQLRLNVQPLVLDPGLVVAHDVPQALGALVARGEGGQREDLLERPVAVQLAAELRLRGRSKVRAAPRFRRLTRGRACVDLTA